MLKPDAARAHLAELKSKKHLDARLARVKKLPAPLAAASFGALGRGADGKPLDWQRRRALYPVAAATLDGPPTGRARVFAALFPTFAAEVEAGWRVFDRLPYTTGPDRRAFRCPTRPALARDRRRQYLDALFDAVAEVPDDVLTAEWVAAWAVHLGWQTDPLGYLLAGVIDAGGPTAAAVLDIVKDSAANRHEVGGPGGHATRGLLCCANPAAWEFAENLLVAAQRQEGLRQVILEAVDEAHPEAFRRMVRLVLDQKLVRFAAVARAAGVWLGDVQMVENPKKLTADLEAVHDLLADPAAPAKLVRTGAAADCYRGLWATAFGDSDAAFKLAAPVLKDKDPGRRFAAAKLAAETALPEVAGRFLPLLTDPDPRLVSLALSYFARLSNDEDAGEEAVAVVRPKDLFERLEAILPNLPETDRELKPPVEGWFVAKLGRSAAADLLLDCLGDRPAERLVPHLDAMTDWRRRRAVAKLCEPRTLTTRVRQTLLAVAGHPSGGVREAALAGLKKCKLAEDEVQTLEGYLTRKTADFRRAVFELLLNRPDKPALASVDRLLAAGDANQRAAGIEVARRLANAGRQPAAVCAQLTAYRDARGTRLPKADAEAIEQVLNPAARPATLDDGLGLIDPAGRSPVAPPKPRKLALATPAAVAFLKALDGLVHEHRTATFRAPRYNGTSEEFVLGSLTYSWQFPGPDADKSPGANRAALPLRELWEGWLTSRPAATRDKDGFELLRASRLQTVSVREGENPDDEPDDEGTEAERDLAAAVKAVAPLPPVGLRYDGLVGTLLRWFVALDPPAGAADFLLDAAEAAFARVPAAVVARRPGPPKPDGGRPDFDDWRDDSRLTGWLDAARIFRDTRPDLWTPARDARLYRLARWLDEPAPGVPRVRPAAAELVAALPSGAATLDDFLDHLIGPRPEDGSWRGRRFDALGEFTNPAPRTPVPGADRPDLRAAVGRVTDRILEVELARGETPSSATAPAAAVQSLAGVGTLFRLLKALGRNGFAKPGYSTGEGKPAVLTHLVRVTQPGPGDTPAAFAATAKDAVAAGDVPVERLVELGMANPRWLAHVEAAVGWAGYAEAAYWFIAHTQNRWGDALGGDADDEGGPGGDDARPAESAWAAIVKARTNLSAEQRADGVIDVAWFHRAYAAVGKDKRWDALEDAARLLGYGQGHKKAARLADVLLGRMKKKELVAAIRQKYLKEHVRLLGLLPLPADHAKKAAELADRYKVLREYERYARGLSALSKEPAMQAARLGLENLAVTAGYPDPVRLEWVVSAGEVADLTGGPATASANGVTVSLTLTPAGEPEVTAAKGGKPLKSVPPDAKKVSRVADLVGRKADLTRAATNARRSLEQAMCAADPFRGAELRALMTHALVRPVLARLVVKTPGGLGYPTADGAAVRGWDGATTPVYAGDQWTVAHPLDLLAAGDWPDWQAECFRAERLQPFKQVFREVYAVTAAEREDGDRSHRYAGQQVNEKQALALLAGRGWSTRDGVGKLFRPANLVSEVGFDHGWATPADAAAPAVSAVTFRRRGDWKLVPLADVPAVVFSEVLRDLDLVVSVAHVGGVDPEATQSTTEMRAALVRETAALLGLDNVTTDGRHVLVRGGYGQYSIHLGSGVVHKQPGGALCVVPVQAQHRGRLFLPFADPDPRTAEVVSKVLLLARDSEIQDPTILQQIAHR